MLGRWDAWDMGWCVCQKHRVLIFLCVCVYFSKVIHWLQIIPPFYRELACDLVSTIVQLKVKLQPEDLAGCRNVCSTGNSAWSQVWDTFMVNNMFPLTCSNPGCCVDQPGKTAWWALHQGNFLFILLSRRATAVIAMIQQGDCDPSLILRLGMLGLVAVLQD